MKGILSLGIFTLFLGACIATTTPPSATRQSEVPKYGILPFETENITPETSRLIPKKYNETLAATVIGSINRLGIPLDQEKLKVIPLNNEQPISRTDVEVPVVSFDNEYKNTLDADLRAMSENYDGIIFGHLEEELAGNGSLHLNMRVYKTGDGKIESFEGEAIDLGVIKTKNQMTTELRARIIQLSTKVKRYIVEPPVVEPSESVNSGSASEDDEDNGAPEDDEDNASDKDKENDFFSIAKELPKKFEGGILPGEELNSSHRRKATTTSMSLKDVYKMLYEQGFSVTPPADKTHKKTRIAIAKELGIKATYFYKELTKNYRKPLHGQKSCTEFEVNSQHSTKRRKTYDLCYDIRFNFQKNNSLPSEETDNVYCKRGVVTQTLMGLGLENLTYQQAKKEIDRLRKETGKKWRIPTIDELYAISDHLLYGPELSRPNVIWSSTFVNSKDNKWVIQAYIIKKRWGTETPHLRLWDSSNSNLKYTYPAIATLFPVYNCGP